MKRIPTILAGLTATLLTICFLEYGVRGLNPDIESDWQLRPAWWQSDVLADGGLVLRVFAVLASPPFERLLGSSQDTFILCTLLQLLLIVVVSLIVFYVARSLFHLLGLTRRCSERRGNAGLCGCLFSRRR